MGMSSTLKEYLYSEGIKFELIKHPYSVNSMETAETAHVPGNQLAKSVLLEDDEGYILAVILSTHKIVLNILERYLGRGLWLAYEVEISQLFYDCEIGAIPPTSMAYGYETILNDSLMDCDNIYFDAGNHIDLVHVSGEEFDVMMADVEHGQFSSHI